MKKLFLLAILLLALSATSFAQFSQGTFHLSGASDLSFLSTKSYSEYDGKRTGYEAEEKILNIAPSLGYFVIDNLSLGLTLMYEKSEGEDSYQSFYRDYDYKRTTVGPYFAYYFGSSQIKPFVTASLLFGNEKSGKSKNNVNSFGIGGGISFMIADFLSLDLAVIYQNVTSISDNDSKAKAITDGTGLSGGISIYL